MKRFTFLLLLIFNYSYSQEWLVVSIINQNSKGIKYEVDNGEKISKSKGNGLSIEEWLRYGSPESLSLFMYTNPKRAKRLFFDVIPKTTL